MREIKFRAWDKDMEMVIYPKKHYSPDYQESTIIEMYNPEENEFHNVYIDDDRFILLQYTGLKDKNDKEIYEGDIVEVILESGQELKGVVKWEQNVCGFIVYEKPLILEFQYIIRLSIKIIGNIYENPELLEVKE